MGRANEHFDQVVVQTIVELALQAPFELGVVQITRMQIEIVSVHRDGGIFELDDEFYAIALGASREVEQADARTDAVEREHGPDGGLST